MFRQHQLEMDRICKDIVAGEEPELDKIIAVVTPGGGKSLLPVILASRLIPAGIIDKICWVTPRESLQEQAEESFCKGLSRKLLSHNLKIRRSTNEIDPSRGFAGYVTTYQALQCDSYNLNADEFRRYRYALILDENHHWALNGELHERMRPLWDRAVMRLLMTGTLERHDGERLAFLDYEESTQIVRGKLVSGVEPVLADSPSQRIIRYTRSQALQERAIIPLHFEHLDSSARWEDANGKEWTTESLAKADRKTGRDALETALKTTYAYQLLDKCVAHWRGYRAYKPNSKVLVVAPNIKTAKEYNSYLKDSLGVASSIATTMDVPKARAAIKQFKAGTIPCLVTVGMAYEGLDVPSITHIVAATLYRSKSWLDQMFSRANRNDENAGPWEQQIGYIFGPDDGLYHDRITEIVAEQDPFIKDRVLGPPPPKPGDYQPIIPLASNLTQHRARALAAGQTIDYVRTSDLNNAATRCGIIASTVQLDKFARDLESQKQNTRVPQDTTSHIPDEVAPSIQEKKVRGSIEDHSRGWDRDYGKPFGTMNKMLWDKFRKSREDMRLNELNEVWAWLQANHPRTR